MSALVGKLSPRWTDEALGVLALPSAASFPGLDAEEVRRLDSALSDKIWLTSSSLLAARISPLSELCELDVPEGALVRLTDSLDSRWIARICGRCGIDFGGASGETLDDADDDSGDDDVGAGEATFGAKVAGVGRGRTPGGVNGFGSSVGGCIPCNGSSKDRSGGGLKSEGGGGGGCDVDVDDSDEATDDLRR